VARGAAAANGSARDRIARTFTHVEDVVYVGLGVLLAAGALVLLGDATVSFVRSLLAGALPTHVVQVLDRVLLILMIAEILYTVQVSFREHTLVPEPFLIVGLIAAIRRVLILTAELGDLIKAGGERATVAMTELGLLTVMVLVLVASLVILRKRAAAATAER
jgi:phosphate starvation-inducible membrane PsiE